MKFKFKFLAFAAIMAIDVVSMVMPANAQPILQGLRVPVGTSGDYIEPFAYLRWWTGYKIADKYANGSQFGGLSKSSETTSIGFIPVGNEAGMRLRRGKLFSEGSVGVGYINEDNTQPAYAPQVFLAVKYFITNDFIFHFGRGSDYQLAYRGDILPIVTAQGDGFVDYAFTSPAAMVMDLSYKGAFFGVMSKGFAPGSPMDNSSGDESGIGGFNGVEYKIPRILVGYSVPGPISPGVAFAYQKKRLKDRTWDSNNDGEISAMGGDTGVVSGDIESYAIGGYFNGMFGSLLLHLHGYYGKNKEDMAFSNAPNDMIALVEDGRTPPFFTPLYPSKIHDSHGYGGNIVLAFQLGPIRPQAGVAYKVVKNDLYKEDDKAASYYAGFTYIITPGLSIQPGVILIDNMKGPDMTYNDVKQGKTWKFGIFFEAIL